MKYLAPRCVFTAACESFANFLLNLKEGDDPDTAHVPAESSVSSNWNVNISFMVTIDSHFHNNNNSVLTLPDPLLSPARFEI